jgi:DNA-binding XRE family transcriptional regulator
MGYQVRMHRSVRDWLTGLRDGEPVVARLVGEAVLAMLDAGEILGPPLVVSLDSALRAADDPREALDDTYSRQLEALQRVRRGVADVATSRKRVELQVGVLESRAAKLASQREEAIQAGREFMDSETRAREERIHEQLAALRSQLRLLSEEEQKLTAASMRLQERIDRFRVEKETIKATYTADEASRRVNEAFAEIEAVQGAAAQGVTVSSQGDAEPEDRDGLAGPPPLMVLLPGAPDNVRVAVLFVEQPKGTATLLAHVEDADEAPDQYEAASNVASARLPGPESGPTADPTASAAFISYEAESFLDEFFAGEETEVEIGAGALVARFRAYTLAEARKRMKYTQTEVARRMNVRQERVSAIERAEPGATEVRTLAAYVAALGGRLEITAHIGNERIPLR